MGIETADVVVGASSVIIAAIAVLFTIYQYKKDQMVRRKDTLLPLISEFDDDTKNMQLAKYLLDDFKYQVGFWKNPRATYEWYEINQPRIFRRHDHANDPIYDDGEMKIRDSFDAILDFFGKLGYLLEIGLIKTKELEYFRYYIEKAKDSETIGMYVSNYEFNLYHTLLAKLNYEQKGYDIEKRKSLPNSNATIKKSDATDNDVDKLLED